MNRFSELVLPQAVVFVVLVGLLFLVLIVPQLVGQRRARAGDYAGAERWYGWTLGHRTKMAGQGNIAVAQLVAGDLEAAEHRLRLVFDDARRRHDARLELHTLVNLGACLIAQRRLGEAAPQARPKGNLAVLYPLLAGRLAGRSGDWEEARRHLDEAAARARRASDPGLPGQVALSRGALEYLAGNRESGLEMVLASAASLRAIDRGDLAGRLMLGLAHLARRGGDESAASRLEAAAARFRGIVPMPSADDCATYLRAASS